MDSDNEHMVFHMNNTTEITRRLVPALITLVVLLSGCVNRSTAPEHVNAMTKSMKPPEGLALIYVARPWAFRAGAGSVLLMYNGHQVGFLGTDQYLAFYALPGQITLGENLHPNTFLLNAEPEQSYFVKMQFDMHINPIAPPTYTLLDEVSGRSLLDKYSLSGSNPFSYLCGYGDIELIDDLFQYSLENSSKEEHFLQSSACLLAASSSGQMEVVRWAHEDADISVNNFVWGVPGSPIASTPLKAALDSNNFEIAEYLIQNGALLHAVGEDFEYLAINHAVESRSLEQVMFLLENGANPNSYMNGETPLIKAIKTDQIDIAKYLISNGAFVSYYDPAIQDPLTLARQHNHYDLEALLLAAGASDRQAIARREEARRKVENPRLVSQIGEVATTILGIALGVAAVYYAVDAAPAYYPVTSPGRSDYGESGSANSERAAVLYEGKPCSSDYTCGVGFSCVKKPFSTTGVCMQAVNSRGVPVYKRPDSSSTRIKTRGDCDSLTDCPAGFTCHPTLKACVK